eukprot:1570798-Pyramimonas_sp.AAC.1
MSKGIGPAQPVRHDWACLSGQVPRALSLRLALAAPLRLVHAVALPRCGVLLDVLRRCRHLLLASLVGESLADLAHVCIVLVAGSFSPPRRPARAR